jgi:bifunctional UDP-N-acetylglucosamine pyrophosphorylase/glucosamine-1-phosphate N-acetyltransferase
MIQVVILAAGKGKRMGGEKPKVLCEVGEKPIVERLVDSVLVSGVTSRPIVVIGYGTEIIKKYLGTRCNYVLQAEQLGTAHAVFCAKDFLAGVDDVLVLYGDHPFLKPKTISDLAIAHQGSRNVLTMMTVKLKNFDGWCRIFEDWGRIIRGEDGEVRAIVEKKDATPEELKIVEVNPSFFCFKSWWLWENLSKLSRNNAQGEYYLTDLVQLAILQNQKIQALAIFDPVEAVGINNPEQLELARSLIEEANNKITVNKF